MRALRMHRRGLSFTVQHRVSRIVLQPSQASKVLVRSLVAATALNLNLKCRQICFPRCPVLST